MDSEVFNCIVCLENLQNDNDTVVVVREKGLKTIKACSAVIGDGLLDVLSRVNSIRIHSKCRKRYTRKIPTSTKIEDDYSRDSTSSSDSMADAPPPLTAVYMPSATSHEACFADACFLCCAPITDFFMQKERKKSLRKRNNVITVRGILTKKTIMRAALARNDQIGKDVLSRIENVDLVKEKARYHHKCYRKLLDTKSEHGRKGRPKSNEVSTAMEAIFNHIEKHPRGNKYSLTELKDVLSDQYVPHDRTLKEELKRKYGDNLIITHVPGCTPLISLKEDVIKEEADKVMDESWSDNEEMVKDENLSTILRAANIVRNDIRSEPNETEFYSLPKLCDAKIAVPDSLLYFLETVITKDKKEYSKANILAIAHAIVKASRPRS